MPRTVTLTQSEVELLMLQDPLTRSDGGFQSLMVKLRGQLDSATNRLRLDDDDLERIPRYAYCYKSGGWQSRLEGIFERTLGPGLGRDDD